MTQQEVKSLSSRPFEQPSGSGYEMNPFFEKISTSMTTNSFELYSRGLGELDCLRVISGRPADPVTATFEFRRERFKERHVWRIPQINPNMHLLVAPFVALEVRR
jgi:hypothetical protein